VSLLFKSCRNVFGDVHYAEIRKYFLRTRTRGPVILKCRLGTRREIGYGYGRFRIRILPDNFCSHGKMCCKIGTYPVVNHRIKRNNDLFDKNNKDPDPLITDTPDSEH